MTERAIMFKQIYESQKIKKYIQQSDFSLAAQSYTEHGIAHMGAVAKMAHDILSKLGYDERTVELARAAGYMHDIGNAINRTNHAQSGALLAHVLLTEIGLADEDIIQIVTAIGSHDENAAFPIDPVCAALIIADKGDVRRSRVRSKLDRFDFHDRVNYAATSNKFEVDADRKSIILKLTIDIEISPVIEYFEAFLNRMILCRAASQTLGCNFELIINDAKML